MWQLTYTINRQSITLTGNINVLTDLRAQVIAQGATNTLIDWVASCW